MTVADKLRTKGATEKDASVFIGDTGYDLPMRKGTLGPDVVDVSTLYQDTGRFTYDPGFTSTASCELKITFIDFDEGIVLYRGYPIEQLAEHSTFLETCYLLLYGELPTAQQYAAFENCIVKHTMVESNMRRTSGDDIGRFTIGVIALGAKMAKADGIVTRDEVIAFKEVFKVPEGEMQNVSRVFNFAKQDVVGYETYANQLAHLFKANRKLLEDVLEGLFHIAMADGVFHPNEERFLADVAHRFGFTPTEFSYIKARHVSSAKSNPYEVLGITPDIDNDALSVTTTS